MPVHVPFSISLGSKLFGSIFGGGGQPKVPRESLEARKLLLAFGKGEESDLFPEQDILERTFNTISSRVDRQKEGATARAASLGIAPGSGLAENLRSGIQRSEAEAFGKARAGVGIAKSGSRLQALMALLGLPSQSQGIDVPNVLAQGGQDLSQLLLLKDFLRG